MPDMTLDEIRDAIAAKLGWINADGWWRYFKSDRRVSEQSVHPVPPSLDWVAANWPKDRPIFVQFTYASGFPPRTWSATSWSDRAVEHPTELHARFALLLAVLDAEGKTP